MHLLYVDDSHADAKLMARLFGDGDGVRLHISNDMAGLLNAARRRDADCVLVDVVRPDSNSLKDDVANIRAVTTAPIIFVTGNDVCDMRSVAVEAGADGVLEKSQLTREVVLQTAANACFRTERLTPPKIITEKRGVGQVELAAKFIDEELSSLNRMLRRNVIPFRLREQVARLASAAAALSAGVTADQKMIETVDLSEIALAAAESLEPLLNDMDVAIVWDIPSVEYLQVSSFAHGVRAMEMMALGAATLLDKGSAVLVTAVGRGNRPGAVLSMHSAGLYLPADWSSENMPSGEEWPVARATLAIAAHLFGSSLEELQIDNSATTRSLRLKL